MNWLQKRPGLPSAVPTISEDEVANLLLEIENNERRYPELGERIYSVALCLMHDRVWCEKNGFDYINVDYQYPAMRAIVYKTFRDQFL